MNKLPTTLLTQPARIKGKRGITKNRSPELMIEYSQGVLAKEGITNRRSRWAAMSEDCPNGFAHDAAFLFEHSVAGLQIIEKQSAEVRSVMRRLWTHAFDAGAFHETISVNDKHLIAVQKHHKRRNDLPARARAGKEPKLTVELYKRTKRQSRSQKELAILLGVTPRAVREFRKRNPGISDE
jgi:hypothetical protein